MCSKRKREKRSERVQFLKEMISETVVEEKCLIFHFSTNCWEQKRQHSSVEIALYSHPLVPRLPSLLSLFLPRRKKWHLRALWVRCRHHNRAYSWLNPSTENALNGQAPSTSTSASSSHFPLLSLPPNHTPQVPSSAPRPRQPTTTTSTFSPGSARSFSCCCCREATEEGNHHRRRLVLLQPTSSASRTSSSGSPSTSPPRRQPA